MLNTEKNISPFAKDATDVLAALQSDAINGLTSSEAKERLKKQGANKINAGQEKSIWVLFLNQFKSPIVWLLILASALSFYFNELIDGVVIILVIAVNTAIGFYMEYQAIRSMESLKKLIALNTKAVRDGRIKEIPVEDIVPGDIIYMEAGDMIPADARILRASLIRVDESALTGESMPVDKNENTIDPETILAERTNMLYKGTFSVNGNCYAVVTHTGLKTELGHIAGLIHTSEKAATPLEKKLEKMTRLLIWITALLVILIFTVGILSGKNWMEMLKTGIALAVAAIPEGLPIVATITLAHGMRKMAKLQVIVKRLSSVETLGGTNIICTDKTGTLTQNKIEVKTIKVAFENEKTFSIINHIAILCNTAEIQIENEKIIEIGDPLETGLLKFAQRNNYNIVNCRQSFPLLKEEPFSSETKMMATLHKLNSHFTVYAKGAAEELIGRCDFIIDANGDIPFTNDKKLFWINEAEAMAGSGLRVIAGAYKTSGDPIEFLTDKLVFCGLFGMIDPPREDIEAAIFDCKSAGIDVIMITGDHPSTAKNIALQLKIMDAAENNVLTGKEMNNFEKLTNEEKLIWRNTKIFARVNPKQKLDLVTVLQEQNNIVGMTGDGVNDAPALKKADIGIAMGQRGTQVSREVADMVLEDDSFSSIVVAIKEGRIIFDNIKKFVTYLLSCNLSEILIISSLSVLNMHFQLWPLQILFINLVTDVLPALALGVTAGSNNIMKKPPRNPDEPILDKNAWIAIFIYSSIISITSIGAVTFSHFTVHSTESHWNHELCNNILFYTLIFSQLLHVFNMGNGESGYFKSEVFRNKFLWSAFILSAGIALTAAFLPGFGKLFSIYPLSVYDWCIIISFSITGMILIQLLKKIKIIKS